MKKLFKFLSISLASVSLLLPSASAFFPEFSDLYKPESSTSRESFAESFCRENAEERLDVDNKVMIKISKEEKNKLVQTIRGMGLEEYPAAHLVWCLINSRISLGENPDSINDIINNFWIEFLKGTVLEEKDIHELLRNACSVKFKDVFNPNDGKSFLLIRLCFNYSYCTGIVEDEECEIYFRVNY